MESLTQRLYHQRLYYQRLYYQVCTINVCDARKKERKKEMPRDLPRARARTSHTVPDAPRQDFARGARCVCNVHTLYDVRDHVTRPRPAPRHAPPDPPPAHARPPHTPRRSRAFPCAGERLVALDDEYTRVGT